MLPIDDHNQGIFSSPNQGTFFQSSKKSRGNIHPLTFSSYAPDRCGQSWHFFLNLSTFFQFSKRGRKGLPLPPPTCPSVYYKIKGKMEEKRSWKCLPKRNWNSPCKTKKNRKSASSLDQYIIPRNKTVLKIKYRYVSTLFYILDVHLKS